MVEIAAVAYALIMDDIERGIPEINRRSHEMALRDAVIAIRAGLKIKRKGLAHNGKARHVTDALGQGDPLDLLIREALLARPDMGLLELRLYLRACQYHGGIVEVSPSTIVFALPQSRELRLPARTMAYSLIDLKARLAVARKLVAVPRRGQRRPKTSQMKPT